MIEYLLVDRHDRIVAAGRGVLAKELGPALLRSVPSVLTVSAVISRMELGCANE